jgi:hypothetical protein
MASRRTIAVAVAAALAAAGVAAIPGATSSHREAPLSSLDPTGDDTDLYAFTAPDAQNDVTIIGNWIPFEDPSGGPNFYRFDDRAAYYLNVDNTGDGRYDIRYQFRFKTKVRNPESFLYALPGVSSISDPKLNVVQTYTVNREAYKNGHLKSVKTVASGLPVAPNNVGPKTFPDYGAVAAEAVKSLPGGGKVFAGQRDDPFFVDLGATFDAVTIRKGTGNQGGGHDDLGGYNVHSIALQIPKRDVTRDGKPVTGEKADNAVVGVWASTERRRVTVAHKVSKAKRKHGHGKRHMKGRANGRWVQVSRLGNPLVNEVVIPLGQKDRFNATQPADDLANFGKYVLSPELAKVLNILYPGLNVPETDRTDIVQALLTGIPGLTAIADKAPPTDTLKINLGTAPAETPNRFGVIGGDTAGFPNGRRLGDDVVDISERVVGGVLKGNALPLGDGVDRNDKAFLTTFPYVAPPTSGLEGAARRIEPEHTPDS